MGKMGYRLVSATAMGLLWPVLQEELVRSHFELIDS